ncbi:telomeric repeat-binding factor 1 isoform X5 [Strix uralensis]|uniref:telomeric repeat-binding factor 1 isoform X5 n=1 Tax=Strix uralensis TaxID=36305 RepID=UPI003DA67FB8
MAEAAESSSGGAGGSSSPPPAEVEAVAAGWMLEFACYCMCRHFGEGCAAEFRRWGNVAQALINGVSKIPTHQKKVVYLCQFLIRIAKGKNLECHFENDKRISPLESALPFWTLLEREENKLEKLHEDIRLLIQIQAATKQVESNGLGATTLQNKTVNVEDDKRNLETKQRPHLGQKHRVSSVLQNNSGVKEIKRLDNWKNRLYKKLGGLNSLQNVETHGDALASGRRRQRWTYKEDLELKSGIRKFGVGNWAKILVHGDFNNRTSVMLKDRWRTLCRIEQD